MAATDSTVSRGSDVNRRGAADAANQRQATGRRRQRTTARPHRRAVATTPRPTNPKPVQEAEPRRRQRYLLSLASTPFAVSTLLHVVVLLVMALVVAVRPSQPKPVVSIMASVSDDEAVDELVPLEIEHLKPHELTDPAVEATADPGTISLGDTVDAGATAVDVGDVGSVGEIGDLGDLAGMEFGSGLGGEGDGPGAAAGVTFLGKKSEGKTFVFVVDNSNSMVGGRFETALNALVRAVDGLGPKQRFYVIFYSDSAYGMFHPQTAPGLVAATDDNKEKLGAWLYSVEMCLHTRGEDAMKRALALDPDVINILGDGAFTDKTEALLTAPHSRRTVIHTFGMNVDPKGERQLSAIAAANGGKFHPAEVDPAAADAAKANPIKRNTSRGSVWGLTLPERNK